MNKILTRMLCVCLFAVFTTAQAHGKHGFAPAPTRYSLTNATADQVQHIYRDGNKVMVVLDIPKSADQPKEIHWRTIGDVPSKTNLTWDTKDSTVPCNSPSTGDWGDPFGYWKQALQTAPGKPKKIGQETVNGMKTTVYELDFDKGSTKMWREDKYGLLVKQTLTPKGGDPVVVVDIQDFKVGKPDASVFAVPSRCKWGR